MILASGATNLAFDQVFAVEDETLLLDETAKLMVDEDLLFNALNPYVQDDNSIYLINSIFQRIFMDFCQIFIYLDLKKFPRFYLIFDYFS